MPTRLNKGNVMGFLFCFYLCCFVVCLLVLFLVAGLLPIFSLPRSCKSPGKEISELVSF